MYHCLREAVLFCLLRLSSFWLKLSALSLEKATASYYTCDRLKGIGFFRLNGNLLLRDAHFEGMPEIVSSSHQARFSIQRFFTFSLVRTILLHDWIWLLLIS